MGFLHSVHNNTTQAVKAVHMSAYQKIFQSWDYNYINVCSQRAFFHESKYDNKNYISWTCKQLCQLFSFLIDNIYIKFGDNVFRQKLGIPLGTDCAHIAADLFLYTYEYDFIEDLTK